MRIVDDLDEPVGRARRSDRARSSPSACTTACTSVTTRCCASCASSPTPATSPRCASPSTATRPRSCGPSRRRKLLTTPEQKLELLDATGYLDLAFVLHFDEARSQEPAEDFVREVLVDAARRAARGRRRRLPLRARAAAATSRCSQRMGAELGFEVLGVGLERRESDRAAPIYSSTRIRELLAAGDVAGAAELLGRPHEVRGVVVEGDRRGRELGFPTANVAVPDPVLPARRRHLRGHVRRRRRRRAHDRDLARSPADLLRVGRDRRCSRRTCSTSTATSTARRCRCGSSSTCAASRSSTPSTPWSRRSSAMSPTTRQGALVATAPRARSWSVQGRNNATSGRAAARLPARRGRDGRRCRARRSRGARRARAAGRAASPRRVRRVVSSTRSRPTARSTPSSC